MILSKLGCLSVLLALLNLAGCAAPAVCKFQDAADLPVTYIDHRMPVVTIMLAGHPERMIVDTGSNFSLITSQTYNALEGPNPVNVHVVASGAGGTFGMDMILSENISVGAAQVRAKDFYVNDFGVPSHNGKPLADGLIGNDLLRSFDIGFDLPDHQISLFIPQSCTSGIPWPGDYAVAPFILAPNHAPVIPYAVDNQSLSAVIDSGAFSSFVMSSALTRAGVAPDAVYNSPVPAARGMENQIVRQKLERFTSVTIGAETFSGVWLHVALDSPAAEVADAILGEDYLAHHMVFIAYSTNTAYLGLTRP